MLCIAYKYEILLDKYLQLLYNNRVMKSFNSLFKKEGISLRAIHVYMVLVVVIMSGIVLYTSFSLAASFMHLANAADQHYELERAAHELMDASDYLTESVQRFTVNGDMEFLDNYFTEAFETNRREQAISKMSVDEKTGSALEQLQQAMDSSVKLMDQEYYAMRLVIEAKGYTDYPQVLNSVQLSANDAALSPQDKMRKATELVLNSDYYEQKDNIRRDMQESIEEVDKIMQATKTKEFDSLKHQVRLVYIVVVLQVLSILIMLRLTSRLGIKPILKAVDRIKEDDPIPENGASEFVYLAQAYNKMYNKYKNSLEHLNFKASHDELTKAYNRAGYDLMMSSIDLNTTHIILVDVDDFKSINDTYGHEVGDRALIKLTNVMKGVFRDDDCICRIGGDEFVVFMVHSSGMHRRLIESKIEQISEELSNTDDGLPPITISVGIVNGKDVTDTSNIFEKMDSAMYESKKSGKNTYTFYSGS